jgi:hypothetical protein
MHASYPWQCKIRGDKQHANQLGHCSMTPLHWQYNEHDVVQNKYLTKHDYFGSSLPMMSSTLASESVHENLNI